MASVYFNSAMRPTGLMLRLSTVIDPSQLPPVARGLIYTTRQVASRLRTGFVGPFSPSMNSAAQWSASRSKAKTASSMALSMIFGGFGGYPR